jgi:hypothetical protein
LCVQTNIKSRLINIAEEYKTGEKSHNISEKIKPFLNDRYVCYLYKLHYTVTDYIRNDRLMGTIYLGIQNEKISSVMQNREISSSLPPIWKERGLLKALHLEELEKFYTEASFDHNETKVNYPPRLSSVRGDSPPIFSKNEIKLKNRFGISESEAGPSNSDQTSQIYRRSVNLTRVNT